MKLILFTTLLFSGLFSFAQNDTIKVPNKLCTKELLIYQGRKIKVKTDDYKGEGIVDSVDGAKITFTEIPSGKTKFDGTPYAIITLDTSDINKMFLYNEKEGLRVFGGGIRFIGTSGAIVCGLLALISSDIGYHPDDKIFAAGAAGAAILSIVGTLIWRRRCHL